MQKDKEKADDLRKITKDIKLKNKECETIYAQLDITKKDAYILRNQVRDY
jgi:hypothetical protein